MTWDIERQLHCAKTWSLFRSFVERVKKELCRVFKSMTKNSVHMGNSVHFLRASSFFPLLGKAHDHLLVLFFSFFLPYYFLIIHLFCQNISKRSIRLSPDAVGFYPPTLPCEVKRWVNWIGKHIIDGLTVVRFVRKRLASTMEKETQSSVILEVKIRSCVVLSSCFYAH